MSKEKSQGSRIEDPIEKRGKGHSENGPEGKVQNTGYVAGLEGNQSKMKIGGWRAPGRTSPRKKRWTCQITDSFKVLGDLNFTQKIKWAIINFEKKKYLHEKGNISYII